MKRLLIFIALLMFMVGCTSNSYTVTSVDWTDAQVKAYFDKQSDIFGFNAQLKADGYKYIKIPFVVLPTYDYRQIKSTSAV